MLFKFDCSSIKQFENSMILHQILTHNFENYLGSCSGCHKNFMVINTFEVSNTKISGLTHQVLVDICNYSRTKM